MRRRSSLRYVVLSMLVALTAIGLVAMTAFAAPPSVTFSAPVNISHTSRKSVFNAITSDAAGHIHIMWLEYGPTDNDPSLLLYTNNVNGSFFTPVGIIADAGRNATPMTAIAITSNQVHLFYTAVDLSARHTLITLSGATVTSIGPTTKLSKTGAKAYISSAIVDSGGRVHVAWVDNSSGPYQAYHRIWANGSWDSGPHAIRPDGRPQLDPILAATNDGRVHMVFKDDTHFAYMSFDTNGWHDGPGLPAGDKANTDYVTSDGTTLYAVWSATDRAGNHTVHFVRLINGSWQSPQTVSDPANFSDFPSIFYSPTNNKVYALWSTGVEAKYSTAIREITPGGGLSDIAIIGTPPSSNPRGAAGSSSISVVWSDKATGAEEIKYTTANTGPPPVPIGSMSIPPEYTGFFGTPGVDGTFNVVVTNTGAAATRLYIQSGSTVADYPFTPNAAGQMVVSFSFPAGSITNDSRCLPQTLVGMLTGPSGTSLPFSAAILVDMDVRANVVVRNPNLSGDVSAGTTSVAPRRNAVPNAFGPRDAGDPGYTRSNSYYLGISGVAGECAGLKQYAITYTKTPDPNVPINQRTFVPHTKNGDPGVVQMPSTLEGPYELYISVKDAAGNVKQWPDTPRRYQLTLDTEKPVPSLTTFGVDGGSDGKPTLHLNGIDVHDNLYPNQSTQTGDERDYWGYWLVVKRTQAGQPTDAEWTANGVPIPGLARTGVYNLAMGMVGPFTPGAQYRAYVRYLDGAGNASDVLTSDPMTVDALTGPRIFMPLLRRGS